MAHVLQFRRNMLNTKLAKNLFVRYLACVENGNLPRLAALGWRWPAMPWSQTIQLQSVVKAATFRAKALSHGAFGANPALKRATHASA